MTLATTLVTGDDVDAAIALLNEQFREHAITLGAERLAAAVHGLMAAPDRGALLVTREVTLDVAGEGTAERSEPVGVAALAYTFTLEQGGLVAWLDELYVVPAARSRGIGRALLESACEEAARRGAVAMELEVDREHGRAERLYERAGFAQLPRSRWQRPLGSPEVGARAAFRAGFDHLSIGVSDLARSKAFYDHALAPLGLHPHVEIPGEVAYGPSEPRPHGCFDFYIGFEDPAARREVVPSAGLHVAFRAPTRDAVRAFYREALSAGGRDNGAPGPRPQYHPSYYGAFVLDPDGHHVEAVCHELEGPLGR